MKLQMAVSRSSLAAKQTLFCLSAVLHYLYVTPSGYKVRQFHGQMMRYPYRHLLANTKMDVMSLTRSTVTMVATSQKGLGNQSCAKEVVLNFERSGTMTSIPKDRQNGLGASPPFGSINFGRSTIHVLFISITRVLQGLLRASIVALFTMWRLTFFSTMFHELR